MMNDLLEIKLWSECKIEFVMANTIHYFVDISVDWFLLHHSIFLPNTHTKVWSNIKVFKKLKFEMNELKVNYYLLSLHSSHVSADFENKMIWYLKIDVKVLTRMLTHRRSPVWWKKWSINQYLLSFTYCEWHHSYEGIKVHCLVALTISFSNPNLKSIEKNKQSINQTKMNKQSNQRESWQYNLPIGCFWDLRKCSRVPFSINSIVMAGISWMNSTSWITFSC